MIFSDHITIMDGAFGTELIARGVRPGRAPELLNLERPQLVREVHESYAAAGSELLYTNTFGANGRKIPDRAKLADVIRAGIALAREAAGERSVALDAGPLGELLEPVGALSFEEAYSLFAEIFAHAKGADCIVIETVTDLAELRAALLAARETAGLPVLCSMSFGENGRTFTGVSPETFALAASPLADAIGINCSLGPRALAPVFARLAKFTDKPAFIKANAGLPDREGRYDVDADRFAEEYEAFYRLGARMMGGCCGTTPAHVARLKERFGGRPAARADGRIPAAVCSAVRATVVDGVRVIGERINPTGKKRMKQALLEGDADFIARQALEQAEAGADILDVNCGLPEIDETRKLPELVRFLQGVTDLPLQIDCANAAAVEAALRAYHGKAIVNSVNGEEKSLSAVLPLAKKYGAAVVGLTVDERGVPRSAEERVAIADRIIAAARDLGIPDRDVFIDCLTLTVSAEQRQAAETLAAIRALKKKYPEIHFVLGVSNVSFGLPARTAINTSFLTLALSAGLDLPILNPNIPENMQAVDAFNVLTGAVASTRFAEKYAEYAPSAPSAVRPAQERSAEGGDLFYSIEKGLDRAREQCAELLERVPPLEVINGYLIPALDRVGAAYESGKLFLPQLIAASESAKACFDEVKKRLGAEKGAESGTVVLATVKGDVHDIGKNIAKTVLENYGYRVIDLGKNVPPEQVVETCRREHIRLCGLSALMTTTVPAMRETVELLKRECPDCRIMVGGAVLTEQFALDMGADYYVKDVNADVRAAAEVFGRGR